MNKHIRVEDFIEQSLVLHEGGVTPLTSVVLGYPQETPETIQATLDVCKECGIFPSVGFLLPLPGTPIYDWAREHGKITDELAYVERIGDRQDLHVNLTSMTDEVFVKTVEEKLQTLAVHLGLSLTSVLKTTTYKKTSSSTEEK